MPRQGRVAEFARVPTVTLGSLGRLALALLSGLLFAAAFPPLDAGWVAWVALAPLVLALHGRPIREAFLLGFVSGVVAFASILAWMRIFGFLAWVLLAAYLGLYPAAFATLARWVMPGRPAWQWVWIAAAGWTTLEYLRSIGVTGFPWALLGVSQYHFVPVIQVAQYTGVYGVSFLVALLGVAVAATIRVRRPAPIVLPAVAVAAVLAWGALHARTVPAETLRLAAVQPNASQAEKFDPALAAGHMQALRELVADAGSHGAQLIVFPETAVPHNLFGSDGALAAIGRWAQRARATIIATSLENGTSNIAVAVVPSGTAVSRYDKVRLVAFGEAGIIPGHRLVPLWTPLGPVGVAVCFESIFPEVSRTLVRNGAQLLAVITNDAWLDGTAAPAQHTAHAVLRAVESGRWVLRAANTGISMVIDPTGRVRATLPRRERAVLLASAAMASGVTPYVARGDVFTWAALLGLLIAVAPQLGSAVAEQWTRPAFQRALAAVILPWAAAGVLLRTGVPWAVLPGVLLAACILLALIGAPYPAGWAPGRAVPGGARIQGGRMRWQFIMTLGGGLAVVLGLWGAMTAAYRMAGVPLAGPGGWGGYLVRQLIMAAAMELWLRGAAFQSLTEWQGPAVAVAVTTALGMSLQAGFPAEAYAWTMVTGALFGLIRARTRNAAGLIIPHAVGATLFAVIATVR